ncbi:hypothetical protein EUX98_g4277, partial [Antrodiella citrinella]
TKKATPATSRAKEESQASIAQLVGYSAGIGLLTLSHSPAYLYSIFFLAVPVSLGVTAWMLRLTKFELLTLPRLGVVAGGFVQSRKGKEEGGEGGKEQERRGVKTLAEVDEERSTGLFGEFYKKKQDKFLVLAPRVEDILKANAARDVDMDRWDTCVDAFHNEKYLLYPTYSRRSHKPWINIFYDQSASTEDMIRSILHASRLRHDLIQASPSPSSPSLNPATPAHDHDHDLKNMLRDTTRWSHDHFPAFKQQLDEAGWRTDEICFADHGRRVSWRRSDSHQS